MCFAALFAFASATNHVTAKPVMTDQAISNKIGGELLFDPGVVSTRMDVNTENGIVTLTGSVGNILSKERATRVAETVKGVRAVVNRVRIRPTENRSDGEIQRDIEAALLDDPATESYEIATTVENGRVTLSGTVDSYQESQLVKTVAKGVRGVTAIDDEIDVIYKTDRLDPEIQQEIEQAMRWDAYIDSFLVRVSVEDGQVALSGVVGSAAEKRLARNKAWVAGVKSVDASELSVEKWARDEELRTAKYPAKSSTAVQAAVEDAMLYDPRVASFDIQVKATGSAVTLRGTVDSLQAKRAAEQDARNTVGASYVSNRIKVRPDVYDGDAKVRRAIRAALARDPYLEDFEVAVTVLDGTAYLHGKVDSHFERSRADLVASRVAGIADVQNNLDVERNFADVFDPYVDDTFVESDELLKYDKRAPLKTDSELVKAIESELWWSPFVDSDEVSVTVDDGIATLTGTVDTWIEHEAATENAYEGGATLVDNDLNVTYD
jgi:osmotically-inducible protein OsmY